MRLAESILKVMDLIDQGVIVVDREKIITLYNNKAKEIFNPASRLGPGHPAGQIAPGDLVALVDTELGGDDGDLAPGDLRLIGVDPAALQKGHALVAIGTYGGNDPAVWQHNERTGGDRVLEISSNWSGYPVKASLNRVAKIMSISVGKNEYVLRYRISAGHMVIAEPAALRIKFYQAPGYTARGEALRDILYGKRYAAKGTDVPEPMLTGRPITDFHPPSVGFQQLDEILSGKCDGVVGIESQINGIYVRCSLFPLTALTGKVSGAVLLFRDITEIKQLENCVIDSGAAQGFSAIMGTSTAIRETVKLAQRVARANSTVLLLGESGTGKGLFARGIHDAGPRRDKPFIYVNAAAIPPMLMESELFGYQEGAFTGAVKSGRPGKFRLADGGTIFLDEIGDLDIALQVKLLGVLQDHCVQPVGAGAAVPVDVRVIAATNRDLAEEVRQGRFRRDLYYRLNVIELTIPPLRERKGDIYALAIHILSRLNQKLGKNIRDLTPEVYGVFTLYDWPGNVRELENVLERAAAITDGSSITVNELPAQMRTAVASLPGEYDRPQPLKNVVEKAEKLALAEAIRLTGGNMTQAMELLQIGRTAFYEKMKKYKLHIVR